MSDQVREFVGGANGAWKWYVHGGYEKLLVALFAVSIVVLLGLEDYSDAYQMLQIAFIAFGCLWVLERVDCLIDWLVRVSERAWGVFR